MPKVLDPERQVEVALKKHIIAVAGAVREVTREHANAEGTPVHVVKALKAQSREMIARVKGETE